MLHLRDTIAHEEIHFYYVENKQDAQKVLQILQTHRIWGMDTESSGLNCYRSDWELRTFQFGNAHTAYVVPARFRSTIEHLINSPVNWIAHNGTHDMRCIDVFLGYDTGVTCMGETHIPSHHMDSRNRQEGGIGHGLKELSVALIDRHADKWEIALKKEFKKIRVPVPGILLKSGPRKGEPMLRTITYAEGWKLIDPSNEAYWAYAAADPLLTYRLWPKLRPTVREYSHLFAFDMRIQSVTDALQRRAMLIDVDYTRHLDSAYAKRAQEAVEVAAEFGCYNINSGQQLADVLLDMGVRLTEHTPSGGYTMDSNVLRGLLRTGSERVREFVGAVLVARQCLKRQASYTGHFLAEMDSANRVHPSINILAARTARMSVSNPALQQLPTKDREDEL